MDTARYIMTCLCLKEQELTSVYTCTVSIPGFVIAQGSWKLDILSHNLSAWVNLITDVIMTIKLNVTGSAKVNTTCCYMYVDTGQEKGAKSYRIH